MSLTSRAGRWVKAGIIDDKAMVKILEFEAEWRRKTVSLLLTLLGAPLLIIGLILAVSTAYENIENQLGFVLDLAATSMLAVGTFHVIVKKLASKSRSLALSMLNFALGAGLLVAAISIENLSPYRSLLIWASFILFSTLVAQRLFKWLVGLTSVYLLGLYLVKQFLPDNPDVDPYLAVALLMAALTPVVLFLVGFWFGFKKFWAWFWKLRIVHALIDFLKAELERLKEWWWNFKLRSRATSIWLGRHRRFLLEVIGGAVLGCMLRKHFEFLDAILWESQSIYTYSTFAVWFILLTLIPKERHIFSMWFSFIGSLEIFLHVAQWGNKEGFRVGLTETHYRTGHLSLGIIMLIVLSSLARKKVQNKWKASELFQLGPLGWLTCVGLISLI